MQRSSIKRNKKAFISDGLSSEATLNVLSGGGIFWVLFWSGKKVQNIKEHDLFNS